MKDGSDGGYDSLDEPGYFDFGFQEETNLVLPFPISDNQAGHSVNRTGKTIYAC